MAAKKKSPTMDGEVKDLPLKKVTRDDAEQVKGGVYVYHTIKLGTPPPTAS